MTDIPEISKPEHEILRILWQFGRLSVRETHDALQADTQWAYTTTKTVMDRMAQKGLLDRQKFHGVFVYQPLVSRPAGLARLVDYFARRVLQTDTRSVVNMFAGSNSLTDSEITELNQLIDELNNERDQS